MANEFIRIPVKSDDTEVLFDLDKNNLVVRLKEPLKIKPSSLLTNECDFETLNSTILEVKIDAIFEVETILEINNWLSELNSDLKTEEIKDEQSK